MNASVRPLENMVNEQFSEMMSTDQLTTVTLTNVGIKTEFESEMNMSIVTSLFSNSSISKNVTSLITCDSHIVQYNIIPALILAGCFIFGILYCLFGYRFFKATMFLTGLLFGSSIVYFFMFGQPVIPSAGKIGAAVGAGLLCGFVAMLLPRIGLLFTGYTAGILLAIGVFVVIEQFYHIAIRWIPIGSALGLGLILGLITMIVWHRALIIAGTALIGSVLILTAVDYYVDLFRASMYAYSRLTAREFEGMWVSAEAGEFSGMGEGIMVESMCWFSWIVYAAWPVLFLISFIIQWVSTKDDERNEASPAGAESCIRSGGANRRETGVRRVPESQSEKYRHLYKVRRANGDVVSKSYMQSIHNQLSPSLRLLTPLPSDNTADDSNSVMLTQTGENES